MGAWRWGRAGQPSAARPARGFKFRPCARVPRASRPPCEIRSGRRTRGWPRSSGSGHGFALSRRNPPELCFVALPLESRGHREGRVLTTHPRSAAQNAHAENRTAAYRWCRSLGLPCAMVGRLMPRSPGSRIPSGLPRPGESRRHRAGWRDCRIRKSLTVATTARTTRFCRTHGSLAPQGSTALCTLPPKCRHDEPDSAVRPHEAMGSRRAIRPALRCSRPTLLRPPQARLRDHHDT